MKPGTRESQFWPRHPAWGAGTLQVPSWGCGGGFVCFFGESEGLFRLRQLAAQQLVGDGCGQRKVAGLTWCVAGVEVGSSWLVARDCFCEILPGGPVLKPTLAAG